MYRFCPIHNFWRPWARKTDPADQLHALYASSYMRHDRKGAGISRNRALRRRLKLVFHSLLWPAALVMSAMRHTGTYGRTVKARSGKGVVRQFVEQIRLGWMHSLPPRSYYYFRIFMKSNRSRAGQFLHYHENNYLFAPAGFMGDQRNMYDKEEFTEQCRRLGLPAVPTIALIRKEDAINGHGLSIKLPPRSLFAKPACGGEGRGVLAWEYDDNGFYEDKNGNRLTGDQLKTTLLQLSRVESYLVQPKLKNHPAIADLSLSGLCTARIVTSRLPSRSPSLVLATFKMPSGNEAADNFSHDGIACNIDHRTGKLTGFATHKNPESALHEVHPDTGNAIANRILPDWDRAVQISLKAHEELADYPGIGWDVGFTPDGPVLIEGNIPLGFELCQIPSNIPLGETSLGTAILGYAERRSG